MGVRVLICYVYDIVVLGFHGFIIGRKTESYAYFRKNFSLTRIFCTCTYPKYILVYVSVEIASNCLILYILYRLSKFSAFSIHNSQMTFFSQIPHVNHKKVVINKI